MRHNFLKKILDFFFKIENKDSYTKITILGIKFSKYSPKAACKQLFELHDELQSKLDNYAIDIDKYFTSMFIKLNSLLAPKKFDIEKIFNKKIRPLNIEYLSSETGYIEYLFPNLEGSFDNSKEPEKNPNFFYMGGIYPSRVHTTIISEALRFNEPVYIFEDCFLRSIFSHVFDVEPKLKKSIGYTIDDITHYIDASIPSRLELMLNDKDLIITDEQKERARKCINKIIETNLSKYNNQPIFEPNIGRKNVKKVLVVDQSFGDWSILKGMANEDTFSNMLKTAIEENPDADIIVKTHPDTMSGKRKGYYTNVTPKENVYLQTEPINPISLIKYVDKIYVCTTQLGLEGLMCGKEVHTFGMPFYANWGLTIDSQKLERRTNKRTLEELFYIAYIMYSHYVNPDKKCRCEIEDAMDYLLKLREEYFAQK